MQQVPAVLQSPLDIVEIARERGIVLRAAFWGDNSGGFSGCSVKPLCFCDDDPDKCRIRYYVKAGA